MWKAIKEFFGHYDSATLQKGSGGSTTIVAKVKAPTPKKATTKTATKAVKKPTKKNAK